MVLTAGVDDRLFQCLDLLAETFEDHEVVVDDDVDDGVGEIVGPGPADPAAGGGDAFAQRIEDVAGTLLEGDHRAGGAVQAHLFHTQGTDGGVDGKHLEGGKGHASGKGHANKP